MGIFYRVDVEDTTGTTVAVLKSFKNLSYTTRRNGKGDFRLDLSGYDPIINKFDDDYIFRVWRDDEASGVGWYNTFNGIMKTYSNSLFENGDKTFTVYGPDSAELLDKENILYPLTVSQANKSTFASTAVIEFVNENIGLLATVANGRDAEGSVPITITGLAGVGPVWADEAARKNLLSTLQDITQFSRRENDYIDFIVEYLGSYTWRFRTGKIGVDRTIIGLNPNTGRNGSGNRPIQFSPLFNNVRSFYVSKSRYNEINTAVVLGSGPGTLQNVVTQEDVSSLAVSSIARRSGVYNAQDSDTTALATYGRTALEESVGKLNVTFVPRQSDVLLWRDYFPGDFVTAVTEDNEVVHKQLMEVSISVQPGGTEIESINTTFEDADFLGT